MVNMDEYTWAADIEMGLFTYQDCKYVESKLVFL